tara:strand:+ start:5412 stop:6200 length:789 start_codon:yes stop_codon:yes gene_type:complete
MLFLEIILYSLVQGITEFLPISSSAHLLILEKIFSWEIPGRTMAIAAHLGSLIAVIFFLKNDLINLTTKIQTPYNFKFLINIILITLPIIIIGLIIFKNFENSLLTLKVVALSSIIGGIILYFIDNFKKLSKKALNDLSYHEAIIIGLLQIFSLIPGTSRAGSVITGARLFNINRVEAAKLGLYTGIPTIFGAVTLEINWLISNFYFNFQNTIWLTLIVILSGIFAFITIKILVKWLKNKSFFPFVLYRLLLGIIILLYIYY